MKLAIPLRSDDGKKTYKFKINKEGEGKLIKKLVLRPLGGEV